MMIVAIQCISSAWAATTIDSVCMTSPARCDCFSLFGLDPSKHVDREDVKQGFRSFAKHAHPDKHHGDKSQWERVLMFGNSCKEFLRDSDLTAYRSRINAVLALSERKAWAKDQLHDRIEELHEEFGIGTCSSSAPGSEEPHKPRFHKRESPTEKMHIFLDNSISFQCGLEEATELVYEIFPRLERTPTSVHIMESRSKTRQLFSESDDFVMGDITDHWTAKEKDPESFDILFMMDVTGSMSGAISAAIEKVTEIGEALMHRFKSVRIGFLGYRDVGDSPQFVAHDFTFQWHVLKDWIRGSVRADGGGDGPENVIGALEKAAGEFGWESERRLLVHILDAPGHPPRGSQQPPGHWLSKLASAGVEYAMLKVGGGADETAREYKKLFDAAAPVLPMMVMGVSSCTPDNFKGAVMDAAFEATPHAKGTFMWEYIFQQLKSRSGKDHEVVIITDGHDNASGPGFLGTAGFNRMMELLKELGKALPRITVLCFCNAECTKGHYKELAMATGGDFFSSSDPGAKEAFKSHMLLSHAERIAKAVARKQEYEKITPDGSRFGWYMPVAVPPAGENPLRPSGGAWGLTCSDVNGARVCSKKRARGS